MRFIKSIFRSLRGRLLFAATLVLFIFIGLTSWLLDQAYKRSIEANIEERLQIQIYSLLTAANVNDGKLFLPELLNDPRFNQLNSGLYGFVTDTTGNIVWRSVSSSGVEFPFRTQVTSGKRYFSKTQAADQQGYFYLSFGTIWEVSDALEQAYTFIVAENYRPYQKQIAEYRQILFTWLGGMAFALISVQLFILYWSIKPINALIADIKAIENGDSDSLKNSYLHELQGVTDNINRLIENERQQRVRYRDRMADLAHSLKTPIAVLQGISILEQDSKTIQATLAEQCQRMKQIVSYQLHRAVTSGNSLSNKPVDALPLTHRVIAALKKVYADKNIQVAIEASGTERFFGEEADLLEILGNLADNAFKLCKNKVAIKLQQSAHYPRQLLISIADDGPGVADDKHDAIVQRGVRADSLNPGQGIGLAMVAEIVYGYHGSLTIHRSQWGGAEFVILM